jgi:hypothetical protein
MTDDCHWQAGFVFAVVAIRQSQQAGRFSGLVVATDIGAYQL